MAALDHPHPVVLGLSTSQVLATAGTVGGSVVLFIAPMLCAPADGRRRVAAVFAMLIAVAVSAIAAYSAAISPASKIVVTINVLIAGALAPLAIKAALRLASATRSIHKIKADA